MTVKEQIIKAIDLMPESKLLAVLDLVQKFNDSPELSRREYAWQMEMDFITARISQAIFTDVDPLKLTKKTWRREDLYDR